MNEVQRAKHFDVRKPWYRLIKRQPGQSRARAMVDEWWRQGIVESKDAPKNLGLNGPLHVEVPTDRDQPENDPTFALMASVDNLAKFVSTPEQATPRLPGPPRSKTFPRPRIHYGRGEA
jgi:hypothetical protein